MSTFDDLRSRFNVIAAGRAFLPDPNADVMDAEVVEDDETAADADTIYVTDRLHHEYSQFPGVKSFDELRAQMGQFPTFHTRDWMPGQHEYEKVDPTQTFTSSDYVNADGSELFPSGQLGLPPASDDPINQLLASLDRVKGFESEGFDWSNADNWTAVLNG